MGRIERQGLERIHRHQYRADIGVDHIPPESRPEDVEQRVLVQVVQYSEVLDLGVHRLRVAEAAVSAFSSAEHARLRVVVIASATQRFVLSVLQCVSLFLRHIAAALLMAYLLKKVHAHAAAYLSRLTLCVCVGGAGGSPIDAFVEAFVP